MTHLHLPDGVLPWWLWAPGLAVMAMLLYAVSRRHGRGHRPRLALLGSLAALMLAAMSVPLGPLGYHLSLAPVVGIVLGGGLAFVAACVVNLVLALLGHGGFTVVGLNALITGTSAALGSAVYAPASRRLPPFWAAALGTALGLVGAQLAWLVVVGIAGGTPNPGEVHAHGAPEGWQGMTPEAWRRLGRFAALSAPFWVVGLATEALVAGSVISFLTRVNPTLLERAEASEPSAQAEARRAPLGEETR